MNHVAMIGGDDQPEGDGVVDLDNIYPALVQCFGIILLGYIAGRFSFINDVEAKGLRTFVGTFSLPSLIFVSLCQLDLSSVNWTFLAAICIAKTSVFLLVLLVSSLIHRPYDPARAGLFAIFCTQSNDFALGYPVLQAIYGSSHPEYPMYLYLIAPVSLVFLNPIGFIFMEIGKSRADTARQPGKLRIVSKIILGIVKNPIIFCTVLGIVGNLAFHHSMPALIHAMLGTLGSAFSACALFLLGLSMVGQSAGSQVPSTGSVMTALILVTMKSLVLPLVTREVVSQLDPGNTTQETQLLTNYGFLYGTIPTAPSVFVFAYNYNIVPELIASTITVSTFISAPLMFITAKMATIVNIDRADYQEELDDFLFDISTVGLLAALWVILTLVMRGTARRLPHCLTLVLVVSQAVNCLAAILISVLGCDEDGHSWRDYLHQVLLAYGVLSCRVNTAVLSLGLLFLQTRGVVCLARLRRYLLAVSLLLPLLLVVLLLSLPHTPHPDHVTPIFKYGTRQSTVALFVIAASLLVTVTSLVLTQRYSRRTTGPAVTTREEETDSLLDNREDEDILSDESIVPVEDLVFDRQMSHRSRLLRQYEVPPAEDALDAEMSRGGLQPEDGDQCDRDQLQLFRHQLLLLLLCLSMCTGAALCVWTLVMDEMNGIYLELSFLDGFLNLGQSIFTFALFGVDTLEVVVRARRWWRRLVYCQDRMVLPPWEDLDQETKKISSCFLRYHLDDCTRQVVRDITSGLRTHRGVARGSDLVTWVVERGLAHTRQEAESLCRHLVRGRVVRHVDNHLDFYDDKFLYTLTPES